MVWQHVLWRWPCCSSSRRYVYDFLRACSRPLVRLRAAPSSVAGCVFVVLNGLEALQARQRTRPVDLGEAETQARHAAHRYSAAAAGVTLHDVQLRYRTWGELNAERDNVLVVCHALTGNAALDDWWRGGARVRGEGAAEAEGGVGARGRLRRRVPGGGGPGRGRPCRA